MGLLTISIVCEVLFWCLALLCPSKESIGIVIGAACSYLGAIGENVPLNCDVSDCVVFVLNEIDAFGGSSSCRVGLDQSA